MSQISPEKKSKTEVKIYITLCYRNILASFSIGLLRDLILSGSSDLMAQYSCQHHGTSYSTSYYTNVQDSTHFWYPDNLIDISSSNNSKFCVTGTRSRIVLHSHIKLCYIWALLHHQISCIYIHRLRAETLEDLRFQSNGSVFYSRTIWQETWVLMNRPHFSWCGNCVLTLTTWLH